jgi:hypothetical protein
MTLKMTHYARYLYPGSFMPEDRSREIPEPTYAAALATQPDDGWYAVEITSTTYKLFTADDGEQEWVAQNRESVGRWLIGEKVHYSEIEETPDSHILISNIRNNGLDGFGVKTRRGNWQWLSPGDTVVAA